MDEFVERFVAANVVGYADRVAAMVVTVPHERTLEAKLSAESPRHNFIDEHVVAKLEALRIPLSGQCDDVARPETTATQLAVNRLRQNGEGTCVTRPLGLAEG